MQLPPATLFSSFFAISGILLVHSSRLLPVDDITDECLLNNNLCVNFFDGCNGCSCTSGSQFPLCTQRACFIEDLEPASCDQCANNLVFDGEGCDACFASRTCDNRNGAEICILACFPGCRCPSDKPFYDPDTLSCLSEKECDARDDDNDDNDDDDDGDNDDDGITAECLLNNNLCRDFFDGCNGCSCTDGSPFPLCTERACDLNELETPFCDDNDCVNNLIFDKEGCNDPCFQEKTCDNPNGAEICIQACIPGCRCPPNAPFFDIDTLSCLSKQECKERDDNDEDDDDNDNDDFLTCPEFCASYFDGCNQCGCSNGDGFGFCTRRACFEDNLSEPVCNECINNLVWEENGSRCWKERTCDNKRGNRCEECRNDRGPQCQCPQNKPFWDEDTQSCLGRRECKQIERERDGERKNKRRNKKDSGSSSDDKSSESSESDDKDYYYYVGKGYGRGKGRGQ